jgi:peptide/nickel transport system substrate-binding protein
MRLLALNLLLLTACAGRPTSASDTIDYYFSYDPRSLEPTLSTDAPTGELAALSFDSRTQLDVNRRLVPGLARTWETDPHGIGYTFHLRGGTTFDPRGRSALCEGGPACGV